MRAIILERQTADLLVESLRHGMPYPLDDKKVLTELTDAVYAVVLSLSFDRVSANWTAVLWFWTQLDAPEMPKTVYPHGEPCSLHGVA